MEQETNQKVADLQELSVTWQRYGSVPAELFPLAKINQSSSANPRAGGRRASLALWGLVPGGPEHTPAARIS
jgi:hypothetical protein